MSCENYIPERDNDTDEFLIQRNNESDSDYEAVSDDETSSDEDEVNVMKVEQDKIMRKLFDDGGLGVENIIEIKYMMELIKYVPENYKQHQESIAKCMELIINMANQYLIVYNNQVIQEEKKKKVKK